MPSELSRDQLSHLTRLGARISLAEIKQERAALMAIVELAEGTCSGAEALN